MSRTLGTIPFGWLLKFGWPARLCILLNNGKYVHLTYYEIEWIHFYRSRTHTQSITHHRKRTHAQHGLSFIHCETMSALRMMYVIPMVLLSLFQNLTLFLCLRLGLLTFFITCRGITILFEYTQSDITCESLSMISNQGASIERRETLSGWKEKICLHCGETTTSWKWSYHPKTSFIFG